MFFNRMCRILFAVVLSGITALLAAGTDSTREHVLLRKDLSKYTGSDLMLTVRELEFAPGGVGESHRHPGPVVVYVLSGSVEVHLSGQSPKVFHAGESFSEDAHQLHVSTRNMSKRKPVRLLSYIISHKGEALTQPER